MNRSRRWLTVLAIVLPVISYGPASRAASCNYQGGNCKVSVNGVTRTYVLHVPSNFRPDSSALVIAFHGSRGNGEEFEGYTQLDKTADQNGFAVAYPDGVRNPNSATFWNAFLGLTHDPTSPDDSGFAGQLILTLQSNLPPDPRRIYVTGFSVGAFKAHRLAIDDADLVAAAGIVEGSIWDQGRGER